jgi:two-component system, NarL family, nitrate/nitrite response regulator NarL
VSGLKLRIAVVDGHPLFRGGVAHILRSSKIVESVAEGSCAADALRLAEQQHPDLMLLDLDIQGGGAETVSAIGHLWPATRLVILTCSERAEDVSGALRNGARGYILKAIDGAELVAAVRHVLGGEVYLTPTLGARLFAQSASTTRPAPAPPGLVNLTPREDQILAQVSLGATNKEIARELKITEKTVKYFMTNIMQKLQVRNRVEAVVVARERTSKAA